MLLVDNAGTHSAKKYDNTLLFKKSGTNCPYDNLEWEVNGEIRRVSFFFDEARKKSKGLFIMCDELGLLPDNAEPKDYSLPRLRELISTHPAFDERSNLEILGEKYVNRLSIYYVNYGKV